MKVGRFEEDLEALERCVRELEAGEVPLEQALALYEEGVALGRRCHEQLDAAEARVAALSRGQEGIEEQPIEELD